jgi:hypothetical protein
MATDLTQQEKELLKEIVNDKFAVGAFSGMVLNMTMEYRRSKALTPETDDFEKHYISHLKRALQARLIVKRLIQ